MLHVMFKVKSNQQITVLSKLNQSRYIHTYIGKKNQIRFKQNSRHFSKKKYFYVSSMFILTLLTQERAL